MIADLPQVIDPEQLNECAFLKYYIWMCPGECVNMFPTIL